MGARGWGFSFERVTIEMLMTQLNIEISSQWLARGLLPRLEVRAGESPVMRRKDRDVERKQKY